MVEKGASIHDRVLGWTVLHVCSLLNLRVLAVDLLRRGTAVDPLTEDPDSWNVSLSVVVHVSGRVFMSVRSERPSDSFDVVMSQGSLGTCPFIY